MGKGEELWDDSALVDAFNDAMSKYKVKKYHGKNGQGSSADSGGEVPADSEDTASAVEEGHGVIREVDELSKATSQPTAELLNAENIGPLDENHFADSIRQEQTDYVSLNVEASGGHPTEQNAEAYNQLLSQYYELEEKRQSILEQLNQLSGYDYQQPPEGSTSHEHVVPANESSLAACNCSSCPYVSNCPAGECCGTVCPLGESDVVKTAMEAAGRALSSMKEKGFDVKAVKDGGEDQGVAQGPSSETDLSAVLNAWYCAGFYTAKYLTEQSMAKK